MADFFIPIAVAVVALVLLATEIYHVIRSIRSKTWPSTLGNITLWKYQRRFERPPPDFQATDGVGYSLQRLQYTFTVQGVEHSATKIGLGFPMTIHDQGYQKVLASLFANAPELRVFYNPDNHSESVLITGVTRFHVGYAALYTAIAGVALLFAFHSPS